MKTFLTSLTLSLLLAAPVVSSGAEKVDFVKDIQPILEFNCVSCHNANEAKGGSSEGIAPKAQPQPTPRPARKLAVAM